MKINYIETEGPISGIGHGVEFVYQRTVVVAFLEGYAWRDDTTTSIDIFIRPQTSRSLQEQGLDPSIAVPETKRAIELFFSGVARKRHGGITENVLAWFNA